MSDNPQQKFEHQQAFLRSWEVSIHPFDNSILAANEDASNFARMALKTGLLLNGGALIAVPAFVALFRINIEQSFSAILWTGGIFILGLFLSWLATIIAYFAICYFSEEHGNIRDAAATELEASYKLGKTPDVLKQISESRETAKNASKKFQRLRIIGIISLLSSALCFTIGSVKGGMAIIEKPPAKTSEDLSLTFGQPELTVAEAQHTYMAGGSTFLLDLCGYPELGELARQRMEKIINVCPNSDERKKALHTVLERGERMGQRSNTDTAPSAKKETCKESPISYADYKKAVTLYQAPITPEECQKINVTSGKY